MSFVFLGFSFFFFWKEGGGVVVVEVHEFVVKCQTNHFCKFVLKRTALFFSFFSLVACILVPPHVTLSSLYVPFYHWEVHLLISSCWFREVVVS